MENISSNKRDIFSYQAIGIVHSEHNIQEETPIQSVYAQDCFGKVEVFPEFAAGLKDIEMFSHIYLVYHLHKNEKTNLIVKPFLEDVEHGVFSTRAPCRPNPIGLSIAQLIKREENILFIKGVDILNGTPLLDIKPYTARFDRIETTRNGWQDNVNEETAKIRGRRNFKK